MNVKLLAAILMAAMPATVLLAQETQAPDKESAAKAESSAEPIYGHQLMTDAERAEYRAKMRTSKTREERDALRLEHHKLMQARAKEKGVTLPDLPPCPGMGQGRLDRPCVSGRQNTPPGKPAGPPPR